MTRAEHILSFFGSNVAIAVAGLTLSASVAWHGVDRVRGQAEQEFVTLVDDHTSRIQELYDLNVATQESVNSFFHASQTVTQEEFNRFLDYGGRKHAPFVAMQYAPRVSLKDRRHFESELKSTYGAETGIWENAGNNKPAPAGERNEYFPILFAFPDTMTPLRGFDVGSEANRRAALALAAVSGKPAMTDPIRLIQHPDDWGFLIFAPFGPSGEPCKDETSCVASVIGFSVGAYRFRAVPQSVIHSTRSGRYDLLIYARDSLDADPVYVHYTGAAEAHTNRGPTLREAGSRSVQWRDVQVAQRTLKLGFINKRPAVGLGELAGPLSQLVLGLLLTGLVLIGRARTLRNLSELRERDRQWATLVSNLPGLVYRCRNDPNWTMEFVSDGITAISGYSHEEFEKQTRHYGDLIVEEDRQRVWQTVQNAIGSKKPFHMEYRIRAADGESKWVWEHGCGV
jgi:PAS domain S-box-containing protein